LVEEHRPGVGRGSRHLCLDDPGAESLEAADPRLGDVARLRLAAVCEVGCPAEEPDRASCERRLGHGPAGEHRPERCDVGDRPTERADGVEGGAEREDAVDGDVPEARLEPDDVAGGGREADGAAGVGADPEIAEAARDRRGVAARGAARGAARPGRVVHGAVPLVRSEHAPGELGEVRLADDGGAGIEHALDDARVTRRHVVGVDARAVGRPDACRVDQVLHEHRPSGQRSGIGSSQRLVEPGDPGVERVGHEGMSATASTSIRAPGITSAETSTRVDAGREEPKASCRTGLTSGRSSMSVRNTVTLTTSAKVHPAAASTSRMFAKTARAWATTSSPPTSSRLSSTGTTPLTNRRSPAWTASVKCEIGSAWPATRYSRRSGTYERDASASERAASRASSIVALLARSPASTLTWKSRSPRVTRANAPRPAKQSNVPRRSFIAESGGKLTPIEVFQPITTTAAPSTGTR